MRQWTRSLIGSGNGLSPLRHQAITGTNAGLLSIGLWGTNFEIVPFCIQENSFENVVYQNGGRFVRGRGRCVNQTSTEFRPWITNHVHIKLWDCIRALTFTIVWINQMTYLRLNVLSEEPVSNNLKYNLRCLVYEKCDAIHSSSTYNIAFKRSVWYFKCFISSKTINIWMTFDG